MVADGTRKRVAVVGGGISGITIASLLSGSLPVAGKADIVGSPHLAPTHDVVLFERERRIGGHTNTIVIPDGPDAGTSVDTGFIVCNPVNYTHFYRFLDLLEVPRRDAEMTFGFYDETSGLHYRGPDLIDLLRSPGNFLRPAFCRMVMEQRRFNRRALEDLRSGSLQDETLGDYVRALNLSDVFITHYLIPLAASIWSSPDAHILEFPAVTFLTFFRNHGMLELHTRPQWQTVIGGSHTYLRAFENIFRGTIRTDAPVSRITRDGTEGGVVLTLGGGINTAEGAADGTNERFDAVILACHADEALALLADPSPAEQAALGSWRYHHNRTILHTDTSLMPPRRHLWASWNYTLRGKSAEDSAPQITTPLTRLQQEQLPTAPVSITYSMNRLQGLRTAREYLVTLNPAVRPREETIIYETVYTHPEYTTRSVASQDEIAELQGERNTFYCGAHLRYGFHEDGVVSALAVADKWGITGFGRQGG
jgi:predicted NAD/FAD-binding protein